MDKKNTVLLTVIAVATLLVAVVGATFAYFSARVTGETTQTTLKAAELGIVFDGTQEVNAEGIQPGWTDNKVFSVENTSDYDMFFDINFSETTNTFVNKQDLVYSITASYLSGAPAGDSNVKMVDSSASSVASASKSDFVVSETQLPDTQASTDNLQIVRVFIPKHSKQQFTMKFEYKYTELDQNDDQGKDFATTINITSLGIDASQLSSK